MSVVSSNEKKVKKYILEKDIWQEIVQMDTIQMDEHFTFSQVKKGWWWWWLVFSKWLADEKF